SAPVSLLSRGEMQRVAIARALILTPPVLVADEPTAHLDAASAERVADLLVSLAREQGSTMLVVSHDAGLLARLDAVHGLVSGKLAPTRPPVPVSCSIRCPSHALRCAVRAAPR